MWQQTDNQPHRYFSEKSDLYAAARPTYPEALFAFLAYQCRGHDRAWDCATGSGQAAVALAKRYARVDATDVSPEQIAHACVGERIYYSVQAAEETTFPDGVFDLVTVAQALHWFDLAKFWPEVQRTLRPGGIFAAWTYSWFHVSAEIDAAVNRLLLDPIRKHWAPQNQLCWDGYRGMSFPFEELPVPEIAMSVEWRLDQLVAFIGTWSAARRYIAANGPGLLEELTAALADTWGDTDGTRIIPMEFYVRVGRHGS